jgi:hypothetical protein
MALKVNDLFVGGGEMTETDIGVGDPRIIIHHLVKSVYQYPKITMVQEIASNARDANVEAGNADTPIQIQVPNTFNNNLVISDHGIGISPKRMHDVFVKIGNSTKRNDNNSDGTFGIGSKIPLAYADQFTVKTVVREDDNLVRRLYAVVKRDDFSIKLMELGEPHIVNSTDPDCDQHTGTSITIPVKPEDFNDVRAAVIDKTEFWKVHPTITGATDIEMKYPERNWLYRCESFDFVMSNRCYECELYVVLNGIKYPVNIGNIGGKHFAGNIYLHFGIGEIFPTLNRESIQVDDDIKKKINGRLNEALATIKEHLFQIVNAQKTYLDAWLYTKLLRDSNWVDSNTEMKWNGVKLEFDVTAPNKDANGVVYDKKKKPVSFMTFCLDYDNKMCGRKYDNALIEWFANMKRASIPMFFTSKAFDAACIKYAYNHLNVNWRNQNMIVFRGERANIEKFLTDKHLEEVIPMLYDINTSGYVKEKRVKGRVCTTKVVCKWSGTSGYCGSYESSGTFDYNDPKDCGYYVIYDRHNSCEYVDIGNGKKIDRNDFAYIQQAFKIGIYGVAPGNVKYLNKNQWKPLSDIINDADAQNDLREHFARLGNRDNSEAMDLAVCKNLKADMFHVDSPMRIYMEEVEAYRKFLNDNTSLKVMNTACYNIANVIQTLVNMKLFAPGKKTDPPMVAAYRAVLVMYPLLAYVNSSAGAPATTALKNYIMLVDSAHNLK